MENSKNENSPSSTRYHRRGSKKEISYRKGKTRQRERLRKLRRFISGTDLLSCLKLKYSSKSIKRSKLSKKRSMSKPKSQKTSVPKSDNKNSNTNSRRFSNTVRSNRDNLKLHASEQPAKSSNAFMQKLRLNYMIPDSPRNLELENLDFLSSLDKSVHKLPDFLGWKTHFHRYTPRSINYSRNISSRERRPDFMSIYT